jgi:hypothetical protein
MLASSVFRVPNNTASHVNQRIADATAARLERCAAGGKGMIETRLAELDREWDIERVIGTLAPTGILVGLSLGFARDRRFLAIPAAIAGFLILHGLQGWAPPVPILRRLGFRTSEEIDEERYALRALRGDFKDLELEPRRVLTVVKH